jgi:high-affinity iron transporter
LVATFVIFLREAIEASMIVAILLSYLDRIGQRRHFRDVFVGVGAAVLLATGGGVAAYYTIGSYDGSRAQIIFETVTYAIAAVVLTYMTFWMRAHARTIGAELRARTDAALGKGERIGLGLLSFQAVGREGLETAVFTLAIVFATKDTHGALIGAGLGLVAGLCVAFAIYRLGKRINLRVFFTVIGAVLMVFAAGLVADIVENMQELGWLPMLDHQLWDTSHFLSQDSSIGDIFHSFFGYADHPTLLQAVCYFAYLAVAITAFLFIGRSSLHRQHSIGAASPAPSPPAA